MVIFDLNLYISIKTDHGQKIYFGIINERLANFIYSKTGINVKNYNLTLRASEVRKIILTIYSGKDKRSLATTPSGTNSFSQTSETLSGTASIETIPHTSKNSNLSKENNLSGRKSKDDTIFDDFEDEEVMFTADGDIAFDGFGADGGKGD